jgi:nitrous oxide reductase accessory protein NosL
MKRRGFILLSTLAPLALLPACARARDPRGLVDIKWGRDTCAHCGMALSDRRFAAQAIGSRAMDHWVFDDVGCAVAWLEARPAAQADTLQLWVAALDSRAEAMQWLDARSAHYLAGRASPMGYNFGAVAAAQPDSLTFAALRERVRASRAGPG